MAQSSEVTLRFATSPEDREAAYRVRIAVFVHEQGVPKEEELDALDDTALHLVAETGGNIVATSRLVMKDDLTGLVGRVAVLPEWRRQGIASRMLDTLEAEARELGLTKLELHAQTYVTSLYAKHGYVVTSRPYMEAGIEHVSMCKSL